MKIKEKRFFELIREYFTVFLPLQKSASSHTIKSYKETLNAFLTFLCSYLQKPLKDISFSSVTQIPSMRVSNGLRWNAAVKPLH